MQPKALAALHALSFVTPRPWRVEEFEALLNTPGVFLVSEDSGFALGRIAGPEAELLTIAVHPDSQNQGAGSRILAAFLEQAKNLSALDVFLEVAESNHWAISLYRRAGFAEVAKREQYFKQMGGPALTALIMKHSI